MKKHASNALVKAGKNELDNETVAAWGSAPVYTFDALPHWDLASKYDLIDFELGEEYKDEIQITFFDVRGRVVETIDKNVLKVGYNSLSWNANNLSNGIYFIEFKAADKRTINKLTLLK